MRWSLGRPIRVYWVWGSGCGGCALEAQAILARPYRALRRGIVAVESPVHADVLVFCGALEGMLGEAARRLEERLPEPWECVWVGDCAQAGSLVEREEGQPGGSPVLVAGCPPSPEEILRGIEEAGRRRRRPAAAGGKDRDIREERR